MSDSKPVIVTDGNATLATIDGPERDLKDYPKLTAAHLLGGAVVTDVAKGVDVSREIDRLMPRALRASAVGAGMCKSLLANPVLLHEMYLLGPFGWVEMMKKTMRADSLANGLTDAELGQAWDTFKANVEMIGGKWRKRKDSRG